MSKSLRITGFEEIPSPGLGGHRYKLSFELGDLINGTFDPRESRSIPITTSRTLQAVWNQSDSQVADSSASAAVEIITNVASSGSLDGLKPIALNTYNAPRLAPTLPKIVPGTIVSVPQVPTTQSAGTRFSILSEDIAELRDQINALSNDLLGGRLLELPQERAILDVYKSAASAEEFRSRIQSLATICVSINKTILGKFLSEPETNNVGSITLLRTYLSRVSSQERSDSICDVLKHINNIRNGYPAHGDNTAKYLPAHDFFGLRYPITEFAVAWDSVLGGYFDALKKLQVLLSDTRAAKISGTADVRDRRG
jgi:hypothetical protein